MHAYAALGTGLESLGLYGSFAYTRQPDKPGMASFVLIRAYNSERTLLHSSLMWSGGIRKKGSLSAGRCESESESQPTPRARSHVSREFVRVGLPPICVVALLAALGDPDLRSHFQAANGL